MDRELSSYAFNRYGGNAKIYNGIHDLETRVEELQRGFDAARDEVMALREQNARLRNQLDKDRKFMAETHERFMAALDAMRMVWE